MNQDREQRIDAYLDGQMTASKRESFERELEKDAALRDEVERQKRIDGSLSRLFAAPSAEEVLSRVRAQRAGAPGRPAEAATVGTQARPWLLRGLAVAAVIGIVAVGGRLVWKSYFQEPEPRFVLGPWRSLETAFHDTVREGFEPLWVCETQEQFMETFRYRLRQKLYLDETPEEIQAIGLSYMNTISTDTVVLLARVRGKEVLVFVDRYDQDKPQELSPESGLHLFRDRIGDLVLYELSPFDESQVIEYLDIP